MPWRRLPDSGGPLVLSAWLAWSLPKCGPVVSPPCEPHLPSPLPGWCSPPRPAVPCQSNPRCMRFCPLLRTLPKCPLEGESEIFRGPGEGMSVAWLQAREADTQRNENTHIVHGGTAAGCAPLFTPTLPPGLSQATSGSSSPSSRPPVGLHPHGQQHSREQIRW